MYLGETIGVLRGDRGTGLDAVYKFDSGITLKIRCGPHWGEARLTCEGKKLIFELGECGDASDAFRQISDHYHALPPEVREEFIWGGGGLEGYRRALFARKHLVQDPPEPAASLNCSDLKVGGRP